MFPLMFADWIFMPANIAIVAIVALLISGIKEFFQGHVGRIGLAVNVLFLWQIFFPLWNALPQTVQLYLNVGTLLSVIGVVSYFLYFFPIPMVSMLSSLPTPFYKIAFYAYGSLSVLTLLWLVLFSGISIKII